MTRWFALCLAVAALTGCYVQLPSEPQAALPEPTSGTHAQQQEAAHAALGYLTMIDHGQFEQTWDRSGPALQDISNRLAWVNMLEVTHKTLGPTRPRQVAGLDFSTQVDTRAPPGEYVTVQFRSGTEQASTTEQVVMQKHDDQWKIVGYFITRRANLQASG